MYVDRLFIVLFICLFFPLTFNSTLSHRQKKPKHKLTKHPNRHAKQQQPQQQLIPTNQPTNLKQRLLILLFAYLTFSIYKYNTTQTIVDNKPNALSRRLKTLRKHEEKPSKRTNLTNNSISHSKTKKNRIFCI